MNAPAQVTPVVDKVPLAVKAVISYLEKLSGEQRKRVLATINALYGA